MSDVNTKTSDYADFSKFDRDWYTSTYEEVRLSSIEPGEYYRRYGIDVGHSPNALVAELVKLSSQFDRNWYMETYEDVKHAGIDPLIHFIIYGREEGRKPRKTSIDVHNVEPGNFDENWYTERYPDVKNYNRSPVEHFLLHGRGEGRAHNREEAERLKAERYQPLIEKIFERILGRTADDKELEFWADKMLDGANIGDLILKFADSFEGEIYYEKCKKAIDQTQS